MLLTLASYNIQYGIGRDGAYDLARIAQAVRQADIVCFQEVSRHAARHGFADQAAELAEMLGLHYVHGCPFSVDAGAPGGDARSRNRRQEFGNMVASRWPIAAARTLPLPRPPLAAVFDLLRCAVESVLATPAGALRVYSLHLSHISTGQRRPQVEWLLRTVERAPGEGLAWEHCADFLLGEGRPAPALPAEAILAGDFNFEPHHPEYPLLVGEWHPRRGRLTPRQGFVDSWVAAGHRESEGVTFAEPGRPQRIDYVFAAPGLAARVTRAWIDDQALGSDHQPIFVQFEL
ncbi:MAG: hydrolase [Alphaproteobacteria bacterium]|nr:hydrolase [Alphaproteobacteria bacterium]